ncbi:MAG: hypothetical protein WCR71_04955 [Bacteroidales bacterium]
MFYIYARSYLHSRPGTAFDASTVSGTSTVSGYVPRLFMVPDNKAIHGHKYKF